MRFWFKCLHPKMGQNWVDYSSPYLNSIRRGGMRYQFCSWQVGGWVNFYGAAGNGMCNRRDFGIGLLAKDETLLYRNKRSSTSSFSIIAVKGFRLHCIRALVCFLLCFLHLADNAHQRLPMEALAIEYRQGISKGG